MECNVKKCLIVWGMRAIGFDASEAYLPVKYYVVGDKSLAELYEQATKEMEDIPIQDGIGYTWMAGQVQSLTSKTLLLTEGFINK